MKKETKLKRQLEDCKKWVKQARETNEHLFVSNMGLMYIQISLEQIINYLEMKESYEQIN